MTQPILIAYSSRYGATREIAEFLAVLLRRHHLPVEVMPADEVPDVDGYSAVVLGSALYHEAWLEPATRLLASPALEGKPVWLFSSGVEGGPDLPGALDERRRQLRARATARFAGKLDQDALSTSDWGDAPSRRPGDYRSWERIGQWGEQIARDLTVASTSLLGGSSK